MFFITSSNKKHFRKNVKECRDVIVEKVYKQGRDGSVEFSSDYTQTQLNAN